MRFRVRKRSLRFSCLFLSLFGLDLQGRTKSRINVFLAKNQQYFFKEEQCFDTSLVLVVVGRFCVN
jgi:hypothetical protein